MPSLADFVEMVASTPEGTRRLAVDACPSREDHRAFVVRMTCPGRDGPRPGRVEIECAFQHWRGFSAVGRAREHVKLPKYLMSGRLALTTLLLPLPLGYGSDRLEAMVREPTRRIGFGNPEHTSMHRTNIECCVSRCDSETQARSVANRAAGRGDLRDGPDGPSLVTLSVAREAIAVVIRLDDRSRTEGSHVDEPDATLKIVPTR